MDAYQALDFVNSLFVKQDMNTLSHCESLIFREVWDNPKKEYSEISQENNYTVGTLKTSSSSVWNRLSALFGEKVSKKRLREVIEKHTRKENSSNFAERQLQISSKGIYEFPVLDENVIWVGRQALVNDLSARLIHPDFRLLSLVGISGIGKTSLAGRLFQVKELKDRFSFDKYIRFDETASSDFLKISQEILSDPSSFQNGDLVEQVFQVLKKTAYFLVLDAAEIALKQRPDGKREFRDPLLTQLIELILEEDKVSSVIIITSQQSLPIIQENYCPSRNYEYPLEGLGLEDVQHLFQSAGINSVLDNKTIIEKYRNTYEGHPLALKVIAGEIRSNFCNDLPSYWEKYGAEVEHFCQWMVSDDNSEEYPNIHSYSNDLSKLVRSRLIRTFDHLEADSPLAHNLLCAGAIYRFPVMREGWLSLFDDEGFNPRELVNAFQVLQKRFLLEPESIAPQRQIYRLHNLIRCTALERYKD